MDGDYPYDEDDWRSALETAETYEFDRNLWSIR